MKRECDFIFILFSSPGRLIEDGLLVDVDVAGDEVVGVVAADPISALGGAVVLGLDVLHEPGVGRPHGAGEGGTPGRPKSALPLLVELHAGQAVRAA